MEEYSREYVASLEEAMELLAAENIRYRRSNKILRTINSNLRRALAIAHENDESFKSFCQEGIETNIEYEVGGLPSSIF
jgi:hypothetical protein